MPTTGKKPTAPSKGPKRGSKSSAHRLEEGDELDDWKKSKQLLKPKDQLELTEAELKDVIGRVLTISNPQLPDSLVEFNYGRGEFSLVPNPGSMVVVYEAHGTQIHKESPEAREQYIEEGLDPALLLIDSESLEVIQEEEPSEIAAEAKVDAETGEAEGEPKPEGEEEGEGEGETEGEGEGGEEGEGEGEGEEVAKHEETEEPTTQTKGKPRKLTNQFNFCERAALTYNNPTRAQETQTIPPPMGTFSANVLQWIIYDSYQQDYEAQQLEKELERERKEKDKAPVSRQQAMLKKAQGKVHFNEAINLKQLECWRVLERMVNQNTFDDIAKDYRYWEDPSDEFREEEGTLLPLWKFTYDKTRKHTVTDIEWNPHYYDLYAVCFGFLDFMKPMEEGAVCLFTLKNPSYPDYICMTSSAVMCVDTHPSYPYMVVVGLYDGSLEVFNIHATCQKAAFRSDSVTNKHRGIVWEVKWAPDLPDGEMNFYSVGTDGIINNWVLMQNELAVTRIITIYVDKEDVPGPDGTQLKIKGCASCVKFHPKQPLIYLVGTEEGLIYKCSTAYSSMFLLIYEAHHMPVYRIDFNRYNSDIFISCSADWRIKIWEDNRSEPLFVFDVGACVGDVKWAPYSSTVFAAVTNEGKVYVFDLNVNKYKPICVQAIVPKRRNKLTRITFNTKMPIIIVGDDKGTVSTLKLSPNLRIPCKPPKKQQHLDQWTLQCMKLDKLLALVREPSELELPEDTAESIES